MKRILLTFYILASWLFSFSQTTETITTIGVGTYTVPCGVTSITVQCWGGGGAGGGATGNPSGGGGAAGGAFSSSVIAVTSGATISYTLGAGGNGGTGNGPSGGNTVFSNIIATGGAGGMSSSANNTSSSGATASTVGCIGSIIFSGGNGGTGSNGSSAGGGGEGAGSTGNGGNGNITNGGTGTDGGDGGNGGNTGGNGSNGNGSTIPGGGGGGGRAGSGTDRSGGNGARGEIRITYSTLPTSNAGFDQTINCSGTTTTLVGNTAAGYTGAWTTISGSGSATTPSSATSNVTGLTVGASTTLQWVLTYSTGCSLAGDQVIITSSSACPPSNDEPTAATPILPSATCNYTTFTNAAATTSTCGTIGAPGCAGFSGGDVWFSITVPSTGTFSLSSQSNGMSDGGMALYSGTPCGTLTLISCDDNSGPGSMPRIYTSGQTPGATLYVRFWENGNNNNGTFDLCFYAPVPPTNDECIGANSLIVNSGSACSSLTGGTILNATASLDANTCGGNADDDVWYNFIATNTTHSISISNIAGSTTDLYHSVYNGTCGSLGSPIICSDPNSSSLTGLTIGNTYYVRIYTFTGTSGQTTTFSVCVSTPPTLGPCGNPMNNDYCSNPATLHLGAGTFSSTTAGLYTVDEPGNLASVFCGQVNNNSWYYFIADATSLTLPITSVSGCGSGGIQAEVYSVTQNSLGCCVNFSSVSNCFNPGSVTTGTITATSLTIGQTYVLMVDGWAGAVCNFIFSGATATGILPIELIDFSGKNENTSNIIDWTSATENNSDYYAVEKSNDGYSFTHLINIPAAGNSLAPKHYRAIDLNPYKEITYYRLKQFDLDGSFEYSNIISINNNNLTDYITEVVPNPTINSIQFDVNSISNNNITVEILNNIGVVVTGKNFDMVNGYKTITMNLDDYTAGIYILKVTFNNSNKIEIRKIIKN